MIRSRLRIGVLALAYQLLLLFVYCTTIAPRWAYENDTWSTPSWALLAGCLAMSTLCAMQLPTKLERPSSFVCWVIWLLAIAPSATLLTPMFPHDIEVLAQILAMTASLTIAQRITVRARPAERAISARLPIHVFVAGLLVFTAVIYGMLFIKVGLHLRLVAPDNVGDVRLASREVQGSNIILAYGVGWQGMIVNPAFCVLGLTLRRWWLLAASIFGQLLLYSFAAQRTVLFSTVTMLALLALTMHSQRNRAFSRLISGTIALVLVCWLVDVRLGMQGLSSMFVRRMITLPGTLTGHWFEFFRQNPKAHLGYSILKPIFTYPYTLEPPRLIGLYYYGNQATNANVQMFADAYANFGYPGMIIVGFALGLYLRTLDRLSVGLDLRSAVMVLGVPAFGLANGSFVTGLLTGGLLLVMLLVMSWPLPPQEDVLDLTEEESVIDLVDPKEPQCASAS